MEEIYTLRGYILGFDYYDEICVNWLEISTDKTGYNDIINNPLQDYLCVGLKSVVYANFEVFLSVIEYKNSYSITTDFYKPINYIEAGNFDISEELYEEIDYRESEIENVDYFVQNKVEK